MEKKENEFTKVKAPRTFGSAWVGTLDTPGTIPVHELLDGKWVETPEYIAFMRYFK